MSDVINFKDGKKKVGPFDGQEFERAAAAFDKMRVYRIEAHLQGCEPEVWRDFYLGADFTLMDFHFALCDCFSWSGDGLFLFKTRKGCVYHDPVEIADGFVAPATGEHYNAEDFLVCDLLKRKGSKATYVYSFGYSWEISLEVTDCIKGKDYRYIQIPVCVDGCGASPLEDCGGPAGWKDFCDTVSDPLNPKYWEMREWAEFDDTEFFDPILIDIRDINYNFAHDMVSRTASHLPNDVETLKAMVVNLMAEKLENETNLMLFEEGFADNFEESFAKALEESLLDDEEFNRFLDGLDDEEKR